MRWFKAVTGARRRLPCVWQRQTDEELKGPYPRHDAGGTVEQVPESADPEKEEHKTYKLAASTPQMSKAGTKERDSPRRPAGRGCGGGVRG